MIDAILSEPAETRTFLVGAGISYAPPTSLPTGYALVSGILDRIVSRAETRSQLAELFDPSRSDSIISADFIRFEELMEAIQEKLDEKLSILKLFTDRHPPNSIHSRLAQEARGGASIFTTNFDSGLETAVKKMGDVPLTVFTEKAFSGLLAGETLSLPVVPIFKIHGTGRIFLGHGVSRAARSMVATITKIVRDQAELLLPINCRTFFLNRIDGRRLVIAGYSGSDDLDVNPTLAMSRPRSVLWIAHNRTVTSPVNRKTDILA